MDLELKNLSLSYRGIKKDILSGINLSLNRGKMAIVGSNGSGKTTLLKGIVGLSQITAGDVLVLGESLKTISNMVGIAANLDQIYRLLDIPIKLKIEMYCAMAGIDPASAFRQIERYDLSDILNKRTRELSTGQDKIFCNIMALNIGYKLALLDEPFETLDVKRRIMTIEDLNRFEGSLLINTHDFGALKSLSGWDLYMIIEGKLYGKFNSSDINRLYLTKGEAPKPLSTIQTNYGTFSITMDSGDTPLSSSLDLDNAIQEVLR